MSWKKRHRSFYYKYAEDPDDIILKSSETAHLIIDVQKTYLEPKENQKENEEWQPFFNRMKDLVIPNIKSFISFTREKKVENIFARIALRVDTTGAGWQTAGGYGIFYPTLYVNKFGLQPGQSYRAQGRTFCDPTITSFRSWWTQPIFWTQPGTIRINGGSQILSSKIITH